jgi:ribosomal protein L37E
MGVMKQKTHTGLICPNCGATDLRQYYTRKRSQCILRKRICARCGQELFTKEKILCLGSGNGTIFG